jgi:molybdopterin synthase catalytic subunit
MMIELTAAPVLPDSILETLKKDEYGSIITFIGTIRNTSKDGRKVTALRIEATGSDAQDKLKAIADEVQQKWHLQDIIIRRRTGTLKVGEIALVVAIASRSRAEGFEACQYIIDKIKEGHITSEQDIYQV